MKYVGKHAYKVNAWKNAKKKDIDNIEKYYNTTNAVKIYRVYYNTTTRCYIADWVNTTNADMTLHKTLLLYTFQFL